MLCEEEKVNELMVVMMSDVYLDDENVLNRLSRVFEAYSTLNPSPCFMLIGDFISPSFSLNGSGGSRMRDLFSRLGNVIKDYPRLANESHFILIPGLHDVGWSGFFPRSGVIVYDSVNE